MVSGLKAETTRKAPQGSLLKNKAQKALSSVACLPGTLLKLPSGSHGPASTHLTSPEKLTSSPELCRKKERTEERIY